ncbi:MAG: inositol monophosphatase family protein [Acidimicrobiales bacterium]
MSSFPPVDPSLVDAAVEIARMAGELTLGWFRNDDLAVDHKADGSPVTAADLAAESLMRDQIAARFPDDAVMGEEHQDTEGTSGRSWVIDPIDGTKAFTKGVPLYSNLLAMVDEHGPAVGVINLPALGETVWAGRGLGAFHNGTPCRVSDHASTDGAYAMTSGFGYWPANALRSVLDSPMVFRTWGDAYGYALVATGRAEAMIDPLANPWDVAPMAVIVPEAGGRYSTFDGDDGADAWRTGSGVATNGLVHDELLALWQ